jgi:hypothetical protein
VGESFVGVENINGGVVIILVGDTLDFYMGGRVEKAMPIETVLVTTSVLLVTIVIVLTDAATVFVRVVVSVVVEEVAQVPLVQEGFPTVVAVACTVVEAKLDTAEERDGVGSPVDVALHGCSGGVNVLLAVGNADVSVGEKVPFPDTVIVFVKVVVLVEKEVAFEQ